jgi:cobalt-zinc-cadmium efflux system protein
MSDRSHHHHHHHHNHEGSGKRLLQTFFINIFITVVEIIGGILSGSLSLLSDALHNAGDALSVMLSYIAFRLSKKSTSPAKTFGYKRIEILAVLFNTVLLIVILVYLFYEVFQRFSHPAEVKTGIMAGVALAAVLANGLSVLLLKGNAEENINVKSTYLHQLGDTLSSFAVVIGGILIYFFQVVWIDPLLTILIGIYILKETYDLLMQAVNILMQAAPTTVDLSLVETELKAITSVKGIHDIHVWSLNDRENYFDCHIEVMDNMPMHETDNLRKQIDNVLKSKFDIQHTVIQIEYKC